MAHAPVHHEPIVHRIKRSSACLLVVPVGLCVLAVVIDWLIKLS